MSIDTQTTRLANCRLVQAVTLGVLLSACLDTQYEPQVQANTCAACHGDSTRPVATDRTNPTEAAPPFDLNGNVSTSAKGVGAHEAHLTESATHAAVPCTDCHQVPEKVFQEGHLDSPGSARVTFSGLAVQNVQPTYDSKTQACTNTYCHGAGSFNWVAPRDSTTACGVSCHGLPPPLPHPQNAECFQCHGAVVDKDRNIIAKALHVNGKPDYGKNCNTCHGTDPDAGGPPPDLAGNTDPSLTGVGAHANHLKPSPTHDPVSCVQCHVVPTPENVDDHVDAGLPAVLTFGNLATNNGVDTPVFDAATNTCSATYCHGGYAPVWTTPRDSQAACGSCHGLPPPLPHPQKADCSVCHAQVIDADRTFVNPSLHVNGAVEKNPPCSGCHGDASRPLGSYPLNPAGPKDLFQAAPPADLGGNTDVTLPGVGAHQRHLQASDTHGAVACNQCHNVPSAWDSEGHDVTASPPAVITLGPLASQDHLDAAYSSSNHTCTNTYCHMNALPNWVAQKDPGQACGTCHALPPPFVQGVPISAQSHPKTSDCSRCHGTVIGSDRTFTAPDHHVDGVVDHQLTCSGCHGDPTRPVARDRTNPTEAAPPIDLAGGTSVAAIGVGAHQVHIAGGKNSRSVPCGECHVVPANVDDPGHIDDWLTAEVKFSGAAVFGGHSPTWNRQTANCTDSWCHGPLTMGNTSPIWNGPSVTLDCTSCHGAPPAAPHPQTTQCPVCHTNMKPDGTFVYRALHINGSVDF
jgi:predicted CxxxxCH...CXXCH cytochrome family protein